MSKTMKQCEADLGTPHRCRKKATFVVEHLVPFGETIGPNGSETVYLQKRTFRCDVHADERLLNAMGLNWKSRNPIAEERQEQADVDESSKRR